jgi:hypothetical protein
MIDLTVIVRLPWTTITYEYRGFKIIYENYQCGRIAHIYQDGQLRSWASDLETAVQWIDESYLHNPLCLSCAAPRMRNQE